MMNHVVLIGRLTADLELKYTQSGKAVANFSLAVDRFGEGVDFIRCVAWNKAAENSAQYLGKGSKIAVQGRMQTRDYENAEGKKIYVTEVICNQVTFLDSKNEQKNKEQPALADEPGFDDVPF